MKAGETQHESLFNQARKSVCMSYYSDAHKYIACLAWNSSDSWELNSFVFFRLNCWRSMYWTWRNMIKTMTSEIVPALSANSLCPLIRAVLFTNMPRSFSLHSSLPPSWSLHLKVKVLILVNYKNPDLHANLQIFTLEITGTFRKKSEEQETIRDLICDFLHFFADRDHFQLGSLSHLLNAKAGGYQELPNWPESAPDPSVRNVEVKDSVCAGQTVLTGPEGAGVLLLQTTRGSSNMQDLPKKRSKALTKKCTHMLNHFYIAHFPRSLA